MSILSRISRVFRSRTPACGSTATGCWPTRLRSGGGSLPNALLGVEKVRLDSVLDDAGERGADGCVEYAGREAAGGSNEKSRPDARVAAAERGGVVVEFGRVVEDGARVGEPKPLVAVCEVALDGVRVVGAAEVAADRGGDCVGVVSERSWVLERVGEGAGAFARGGVVADGGGVAGVRERSVLPADGAGGVAEGVAVEPPVALRYVPTPGEELAGNFSNASEKSNAEAPAPDDDRSPP